MLDVTLPVGRRGDRVLGELRFPELPDGITAPYLACGYREAHRR